MNKLTLVNLMCRRMYISTFVMLPIINGKAFLSSKAIDDIFYSNFGFIPQRGETISLG